MNQAKTFVLLLHCLASTSTRYKLLPMGFKFDPDFAQQVMKEVLYDIDDTGVYLDYIGTFSFTWERHILLLDKILHWMETNGFTVNLLK
ncbi:hypothetical protein ACHAXS_001229 [Conticribra weissflogii]